MAKKEPPQEYIEVLEVLNVLYDEVDGCSFYDYIFPDNLKQGEQCGHYDKPNAVYLYTDDSEKQTVIVPNFNGLTVNEAKDLASSSNLNIQIAGNSMSSGTVVAYRQSEETQAKVEKGTVVTVTFKNTQSVLD